MATFTGQPFKFQNVPPGDVFPTTAFWNSSGLRQEPDNQTEAAEEARSQPSDLQQHHQRLDIVLFSSATSDGAVICKPVDRKQQYITRVSRAAQSVH